MVAGISVLAAVPRLLRATEGISGDEVFTRTVTAHATLGGVLREVAGDLEITPPLYFVLAWIAQQLGDDTLLLRAPSLVAGILCVPLVYAVGVRTVGREAGLIAAGLLALSPFAIAFSAEGRAYSLATMLCLVASLAALEACTKGGLRWWVLFGASTAGAVYSHYTAVFVLGALVVWLAATQAEARRRLALTVGAAALAFAPWLPEMVDDRSSGFQQAIGRTWPFTFPYVRESLVRWGTGVDVQPPHEVPGTAFVLLFLAGVLAAAAGLAAAARHRQVRLTSTFGLVLLLAAAAPAGTIGYSLVGPSIFVPRTLLTSLPFLLLAIGFALASVRRPLAVAAGAAIAVSFGVGTALAFAPDHRRPAFDRAAAWIDARRGPDAPLVYEFALFEPGFLEAELPAPFVVRKSNCGRAFTGPGQYQRAPASCGDVRGLSFAAAKSSPFFVVEVGDLGLAPPASVLRSHRRTGRIRFRGLLPLTVSRYVPR